MNKDCSKVSIERGSDGRFTVLLTGSKDDSGLQHIHCQWSKDGAAHQLWHDSRARHC